MENHLRMGAAFAGDETGESRVQGSEVFMMILYYGQTCCHARQVLVGQGGRSSCAAEVAASMPQQLF